MPEYPKLSPEDKDRILTEFKKQQDRGLLSPAEVFNPDGFEFAIRYGSNNGRAAPIPEFRVYAQQFLSWLAIVLISYRERLPHRTVSLGSRVEPVMDHLYLFLTTDLPLAAYGCSVSGPGPLNVIGEFFSAGLRRMFPKLDIIAWDSEPTTNYAKFWTSYPGGMTADGLACMLQETGVTFTCEARLELPYPTPEQQQRVLALRHFIVGADEGESV